MYVIDPDGPGPLEKVEVSLPAYSTELDPYPAAKMSSAKLIVCYKCQGTSESFKVGENTFQMSNGLDPDETPS